MRLTNTRPSGLWHWGGRDLVIGFPAATHSSKVEMFVAATCACVGLGCVLVCEHPIPGKRSKAIENRLNPIPRLKYRKLN